MNLLKRKAFTLIEVLVAGGVLFIVSSAVVGLSNSIIQGTSKNADVTVTNRWATEGIELTSKIRTDSLKTGGSAIATNEKIWFAPAADWNSSYGWYKLAEPTPGNWKLEPINNTVHLAMNLIPGLLNQPNEQLVSQGLQAYRLICIEAYGATALQGNDDYIDCNRAQDSRVVRAKDGSRSVLGSCQADDLFCLSTKDSLNVNRRSQTDEQYIPSGNAVKVRSVIVWQNRTTWQTTELGTVFTNWKGTEQN